jgi:hypothetical protein
MKKIVLATLFILVALATLSLSAAEIDFSSSKYNVKNLSMIKETVLGFAVQDRVNRNILWTGAGKIDIERNAYPGGGVGNSNWVDFDKNGNGWFACSDGLKYKNTDGTLKVYTVADGLAATNCSNVLCDKDDDVLIVGNRGGLSISTLDGSGKPTGFLSPLGSTIHQIIRSKNGKKPFVAVNTQKVFVSTDGKEWATYDSLNSTIKGYCHAASFDVNGNLYVTTSRTRPDLKMISEIAKLDCANNVWSTIDMSSVNDTMTNINQIVIDSDNKAWCTFPIASAARPGNPVSGWLVKMDLADGTIEKSATDGTGQTAWLNEKGCGNEPQLSLTADGGILIAANGVLIIGGSSSVVRDRFVPVTSKVEYENFQFTGMKQFNLRGQLVSRKNTFSNPASGIYFFRTPDKSKMIKSLTAK